MIGLHAVRAKGYFDVEATCEGPLAKPPQSCFLDGIQAATGATLGKRTLAWVQADQIAVRIRNTRTGETAELRPTSAIMELLGSFKALPKAGAGHGPGQRADERLESLARKIAAMPEKEVASVTMVGEKEPFHAEEPHVAREAIEWCNIWIPDANETKLPRVLLIGDSIVGGYGPKVAELLKGKASVARLTTSKSVGDPALLVEAALVLDQCRFDVVHFNNGLHGWGYSEAEYEKHFPELTATIRRHAPKAKLIWATTTPIRTPTNLGLIAENTKRVQARNKIAEGIVTKEGIAVDDLYGLVKDHPEYWSNDGVHFNGKGVAAQAEQVAEIRRTAGICAATVRSAQVRSCRGAKGRAAVRRQTEQGFFASVGRQAARCRGRRQDRKTQVLLRVVETMTKRGTTMTKSLCILAAAAALAATAAPARQSRAAPLERRWIYLAANLLVDKNVEEALNLLERAAKAGYNGVVLSDSKFLRWDQLPDRYVQNVRRVRQACRDRKLACIACVCPIGYANDLLSRDPNLAEGLPVVDAPFVAKRGRLVPADESARLVNGGFEQSRNNLPAGWSFVDQPGKIAFIDTAVRFAGRASLRMQDIGLHDPQYGHGRACQALAVKPFRYYHVSAAVKTQDFEAAGEVRIAVLAKDGASLNYYQPHVEPTQDWKRIDVTFNSLEFSQVNLYLGVWGGKGGKIWWDDVRVEPGGLVNVVRREGAPLRAASADGQTVYREGRDFQNARDPKLGMIPWPGGFTVWHDPPVVDAAAGQPHSRRPEGLAQLLPHGDHL